jgi:hypothetical protein
MPVLGGEGIEIINAGRAHVAVEVAVDGVGIIDACHLALDPVASQDGRIFIGQRLGVGAGDFDRTAHRRDPAVEGAVVFVAVGEGLRLRDRQIAVEFVGRGNSRTACSKGFGAGLDAP